MKIAFGGKGGVGKTTLCAAFARSFAEDGFNVLAIDADPNPTLAAGLGLPSRDCPTPLIEMKHLIAERTGVDDVGSYFKLNPLVADLPDEFSVDVEGVKLLTVGAITQADAGCACPQGAFLRALLTHIILQRQEVVLVDLPAGVEALGRGAVQGVDAFIVVVEPAAGSIDTAKKVGQMAKDLGVRTVAAVANKITDSSHIEVIRSRLNDIALLAAISYRQSLREADLRGEPAFAATTEFAAEVKNAKEKLIEIAGGQAHARLYGTAKT